MGEEISEEMQQEADALMDEAKCVAMEEDASIQEIEEMQKQLTIRMAKWFIELDKVIGPEIDDNEWDQLIEDMKICISSEKDLEVETARALCFEVAKWLIVLDKEFDSSSKSPEWIEAIDTLKFASMIHEENL